MGTETPLIAATPPPVPGVRTCGYETLDQHALFWVHAGAAHLLLTDGDEFRLSDGQGIWVPRSAGGLREIVTESGTVLFPLQVHQSHAPAALSQPVRFTVPHGWRDWLIQHFSLGVSTLTAPGYSRAGIIDVLNGSESRPPSSRPGTEPASLLDPPAVPRSGGARAVAEGLLLEPALDLTIDEWAARAASSPRTLLREFVAETGLTFEQWRLRCRLIAAVDFLIAGYDVDQVAVRVGFASRNGFTRAFKQHFGSTPHEFRRELGNRLPAGDLPRRAAAARQSATLVCVAQGLDPSGTAPRLLPATRSPVSANNTHLLGWMYRGSGHLQVGDRPYAQSRGAATWIPAGVEHVLATEENSITLALGRADPADYPMSEPQQVQFPPSWDDYLLHCAISFRTLLRPEGYDEKRVLDLFRDQVTAQQARSVPMPIEPRARAAATSFLRALGTPGEAATCDLPPEVHRAFREQTGMTFAHWCYATRMRIARDLLAAGAKPSGVARRIGYTYLPNFSRAFSRFHGASPREYQEREFNSTHE